MKIIALIPARSGSKRCPGKNTRMFFGHPLIAYTIKAAQEGGIFDKIMVSSNDEDTWNIAVHYGSGVIFRPDEISGDTSTDLEWVNHALNECPGYDAFAILRPTSPFRSAALIRDAWRKFKDSSFDSLRTMEIRDHPGKMWEFESYLGLFSEVLRNVAHPYVHKKEKHLYDKPTQELHKMFSIFTQNGCLQIARTNLLHYNTITGIRVYGYDMTGDLQGFDINTEIDWILAEELVKRGMVKLPQIGG